jgi:hypothetical protein
MKFLPRFTSSLVSRLYALIVQSELAHPGMHEVVAMVYVGDVYVLREQLSRQHADGWRRYHYSCATTGCKPLP